MLDCPPFGRAAFEIVSPDTTPAERVQELRRLIRHHDERYYILNLTEITDAEYDALMFLPDYVISRDR